MNDSVRDWKGTEVYYHGICLKRWEKCHERPHSPNALLRFACSRVYHTKSGDRMIANNELEKMWNESVVVQFHVPSPATGWKGCRKHSAESAPRLGFEPGTSWVYLRSVTASANLTRYHSYTHDIWQSPSWITLYSLLIKKFLRYHWRGFSYFPTFYK
jgi:hypothetical protein